MCKVRSKNSIFTSSGQQLHDRWRRLPRYFLRSVIFPVILKNPRTANFPAVLILTFLKWIFALCSGRFLRLARPFIFGIHVYLWKQKIFIHDFYSLLFASLSSGSIYYQNVLVKLSLRRDSRSDCLSADCQICAIRALYWSFSMVSVTFCRETT